MGELKQFVLSVLGGIISSFIYSIILVFFGVINNSNDLSITSFLMVLIKNWLVLLVIFVVMALIIFQRLRIIKSCNVNKFQKPMPFVAIDFIRAYDLIWQVNIQDNFISQTLPNFTYNLNGPFCSNIFDEDICLTPLKIKNRFLFYELKCPTCNKRYFKFKNLNCYKKDIELKIYPYLIKNKISSSEQFIEFIKNNKYF